MKKYISIIDFNELSQDEKAWYLWHGATFLHVYENSAHRVNLFYLNNYYIELWYNMQGNKVDNIRAFTSIDLLDPFLDTIQIESIISI